MRKIKSVTLYSGQNVAKKLGIEVDELRKSAFFAMTARLPEKYYHRKTSNNKGLVFRGIAGIGLRYKKGKVYNSEGTSLLETDVIGGQGIFEFEFSGLRIPVYCSFGFA